MEIAESFNGSPERVGLPPNGSTHDESLAHVNVVVGLPANQPSIAHLVFVLLRIALLGRSTVV